VCGGCDADGTSSIGSTSNTSSVAGCGRRRDSHRYGHRYGHRYSHRYGHRYGGGSNSNADTEHTNSSSIPSNRSSRNSACGNGTDNRGTGRGGPRHWQHRGYRDGCSINSSWRITTDTTLIATTRISGYTIATTINSSINSSN
jgi:hypothetical protein